MAESKKSGKVRRPYFVKGGTGNGVDVPFVFAFSILALIGLAMVFSASYPKFSADSFIMNFKSGYLSNFTYTAVGLLVMVPVSRLDYTYIRRYANLLYLIAIVLLVACFFFGDSIHRSIRVAGFTFQSSEFAKTALIIWLASVFSENDKKLRSRAVSDSAAAGFIYSVSNNAVNRIRGVFGKKETDRGIRYEAGLGPVFKAALGAAIVMGLILAEPHASGAAIVGVITLVLFIVSPVKLTYYLYGGIAAALLGAFAYLVGFIKDYQLKRIVTFFSQQTADDQAELWQTQHSLYAIGSGGLFGRGYGNSIQKYSNLSQANSDFIFATVCEEMGIIFGIVIICLFIFLLWRGLHIALHTKDRFGRLIVIGIMTRIAVQVLLHIAVVTNLMANTGVTMPFFSAGGTSTLMTLVDMGLVMSVSLQSEGSKTLSGETAAVKKMEAEA